jgi:hypothetical protein
MSSPQAVQARLLSASTPAEIIGASWDAFECIRLYADELAEQVTDNFPAWASAGAPACEGRDALGRAPSMPEAAASPGSLPGIAGASEHAAARLAGELAALLQHRLGTAAEQAAVPGDTEACLQASRAAAEILGLFAGA